MGKKSWNVQNVASEPMEAVTFARIAEQEWKGAVE